MRSRRGRGWVRAGVAIALVVIAVMVSMQTRWAEERVGAFAANQARRFVDGDVRIARVSGALSTTPSLHDVTIRHNGRPVARVERVDLRYDPVALVRGGRAIEAVSLVRPVIHLERGPVGLTIVDALTVNGSTREGSRPIGSGPGFSILDLRIMDGDILLDEDLDDLDAIDLPARLRDVEARMAIARDMTGFTIDIAALGFASTDPELTMRELTGRVRIEGDRVSVRDVSLRTAASALSFEGTIEGAFDHRDAEDRRDLGDDQ